MKTNCRIKAVMETVDAAKTWITKRKRNEKFKTLSRNTNFF